MGKGKTSGKTKPKFKTFSPENIETINARKLQENESDKTQNSGKSSASSLERRSHIKKYEGTSRSGLGSEEPKNPDVKSTTDPIKAENQNNSIQEKNVSEIAQSEKHVDKPEPSQHIILQDNAQASIKVDFIDVDFKSSEEPNLTRSAEDVSEHLEESSCSYIPTPTKEMNIVNPLEVTKEVTSPRESDMERTTKKEVIKPQPDNPSWFNNPTSPPQIRHPFSSLNPDATEFTPTGLFGNSDLPQSTTVGSVEKINLPVPFMNPIRQEITAPHQYVPPGIILQTTNSLSNQNFPKPPFQASSSLQKELSEPVAVMALPTRITLPVPDLKNSTSSWKSEQIVPNYYLAERERITPIVQGQQDTAYHNIGESVPNERINSGTNWAQRTAQGLTTQPSSENIPSVASVHVKTSSGNWSDDDYTETTYPTPNESSNVTSNSHSRNRDFVNKNSDSRRNYSDRRGRGRGRGGAEGYWGYHEDGRRNEKHRSSETEKTHPRDPNENFGSSGNWQEGTEESNERIGRHDNFNRKNNWSQRSFDNSKNVPDYNRRGRGRRQDDYRGRDTTYQNRAHDNRPHENRDDESRGHSRSFPRHNSDSSFRNNDPRPNFGNDTVEPLPAHENTTDKVRNFDESRPKSDMSWRDRNSDDRNKYFPRNKDDRSRDSNKHGNYNNARYSDSKSTDGARYGRGGTRYRNERDSNFQRGRGSGRGRGSNNSYHPKNEARRGSGEGTPAILNDDSSKDSADNYHITDESSSDVPEKNVEQVETSPENTWGKCDVTHDTDDSWNDNDDWNASVDSAVATALEQADWNILHDEKPKNQSSLENAPDFKEGSNVSKMACDDYPTLEQEKGGGAASNKYSIDDSNKWQECNRPRRSFEPTKAKDPRMERERLNRSAESADLGWESPASWKDAGPRLRQTRITSYSTGRDTSKEKSDQEFDRWEATWDKIKDFTIVVEIQGNLFEQPKDHSLAHCVAEDLRMGSGIAVDFKREFKNLPDLLDQRAKQGGLATLHDEENKRFVYYLVTKRESTGKPTYFTLWRSLNQMKTHIKENEITKLAIPRLGCGLDRLEWAKVKSMIEHIFKDIAVEIRVCNFQQDEDVPKQFVTRKLVVEEYPITKIGAGTLIFYFSTENGDVDENMQELSNEFNYLPSLQSHKTKNLGEIVYTECKNVGLCGCIVRKTTRDQISFKSLVKCVQDFNKKNKKFGNDAFEYVAFQWVKEDNYSDDLINEKIITVLINYLRDVDVYVCRGSFDSARI